MCPPDRMLDQLTMLGETVVPEIHTK
jgi:hypothetical protein